ncbi:5-methyltetrahydropteroyltriglutamate--homocysteine S-methyltransferase [Oxalobacter vibrioformis]|uniref:5-methyltetrahydropteroyltriglutamate--homocysteine methyltransferase n=1 Tax=Oxalobacter vibrioformis TaxID=933080 RepID=A0A9E9LYK8_9BURK|nr:5-methyltetrahydropteroyltriglutamate--homocysteine S-methyltransferase [Oxalobacter vibrioformis]WAW09618.1 5-methyltetrahydropteroyltriglutamate--homocysteine S-methyltransferase [Oxalobacter vibrioformis]
MRTHTLGFPRIGENREQKTLIENYWKSTLTLPELVDGGKKQRLRNWAIQKEAGIQILPVGDFSSYDHILDMALMLGVVPPRFAGDAPGVNRMFRMARGEDGANAVTPLEMTKWFDTNYHYLVPELEAPTVFKPDVSPLLAQIDEAIAAGYTPKAVIPGPLSFLWLSKTTDGSDKWQFLHALTEAYISILAELSTRCSYIQIDEPIFALDLPEDIRASFPDVYSRLRSATKAVLILASYFAGFDDNLVTAITLPVDVLHLDLARAPQDLDRALKLIADGKATKDISLSLGLVNGRNVWKVNAEHAIAEAKKAVAALGRNRVWIGSSCSLLHSPVDLDAEKNLPAEVKEWLAFAKQKCAEIRLIAETVDDSPSEWAVTELEKNRQAQISREKSPLLHDPAVEKRVAAVDQAMLHRSKAYSDRIESQRVSIGLDILPTTTIGSFPQTPAIRGARSQFKNGKISESDYQAAMKQAIEETIREQEKLGLDVLVHGEAERNDMVEYFGEQLAGFAFTANGWVQSYGTRCVKPPILYGDVSRPRPMTVEWITYAQSLTDKPVKGMLTGPVTIACWSFVRDDIPQETVLKQLALAVRDEVVDLEKAGIKVIQVDEPALREGLPLRKAHQDEYLRYAVEAFRLATSGVQDQTQIHTHMCYCDYHQIIDPIADMDADVISLEASRSGMELLDVFADNAYPNEAGPGVYDIHSPRVPSAEEIESLLKKAVETMPVERIWVNPDCGLKTRNWEETRASLANMVKAAEKVRQICKTGGA